MSDYNHDPIQEANPYRDVWEPLLQAAEAESDLSPSDTNTLQIREACLQLADYFDALGEGLVDTRDAVAFATALARYYTGYVTLQRLGIQEHAQTQRTEDDYRTPSILVEYVAGQLMSAIDRPTMPLRQVIEQLEAISEHKIAAPTAYTALMPKAKNWLAMRCYTSLTVRYLASDLGQPRLSPDGADDQTCT